MSETKPKPKSKGGGGGLGLFDGDDEDDLFSGTASKPSTAPVAQGLLTCSAGNNLSYLEGHIHILSTSILIDILQHWSDICHFGFF